MNTPFFANIRIRRDTRANFAAAAFIPGVGEPAYETDSRLQRIGDGVTPMGDLDAAAYVDGATHQFGDDVRARIAANLTDPATPEGAALAEVVAASGGGGTLAYDSTTGVYSVPAGSSITYDASTGAYSSN